MIVDESQGAMKGKDEGSEFICEPRVYSSLFRLVANYKRLAGS